MRSGRVDFFASEEECRALVDACMVEGLTLSRAPTGEGPNPLRRLLIEGVVVVDLPTERDGTLLLGAVSFRVDDAEGDEARRVSGIVRGMLRELGDHRVVVRSADGKVRAAPSVTATDGARELADLGWELRQAGVANIEYVIG